VHERKICHFSKNGKNLKKKGECLQLHEHNANVSPGSDIYIKPGQMFLGYINFNF